MKKLIAFLILVITFSTVTFASNEEAPTPMTKLSGSVIDKNTGEALAGVKVVLDEINEVVYTDFNGNFEFKSVKTASYTVKAELISYKNQKVEIDLSRSNDIKIEVEN